MMRKTHRIIIAALAAIIAVAGFRYGNVRAENSKVNYADSQLLLLNGEAIIPEDFPNIFNTYKTKNDNLEQYLEHVYFLEILRNGRQLILPVRWSQNKVTPMFGTKHIGTLSQDLSEFILNDNFFAKDDIIRFIHLRRIESTLSYLDIDINDSRLSQLKECIDNDKPMKYKDLLNIFKMIIPKEMQPIKLETPQVNINPTIPRFTDEFLNKPFDLENLATVQVYSKEGWRPALIEFCEIIGGTTYINDYASDKMYNVINMKFELDTVAPNKSDIVKNKGYSKNVYSYGYNIYLECALMYIGEHYPAMIEPLLAVKTYGDLLEVYQMLPLEVQRQYKASDFKDNPYVDPSWWAERPYVELSIGSSGQEVLDMKQRFLELGYFRTTSFNDRFTDSTADTVRMFEKNNGLPVDGVADAVMLGVLFSDNAIGK